MASQGSLWLPAADYSAIQGDYAGTCDPDSLPWKGICEKTSAWSRSDAVVIASIGGLGLISRPSPNRVCLARRVSVPVGLGPFQT